MLSCREVFCLVLSCLFFFIKISSVYVFQLLVRNGGKDCGLKKQCSVVQLDAISLINLINVSLSDAGCYIDQI